MKKSMVLAVLGLVLTAQAQAGDVWNLVKKTSGPASFECAPSIELVNDKGDISVVGTSTIFYAVNKGAYCRQTNSSEIVRRQRCTENTLIENSQKIELSSRTCTGSFFGTECNPRNAEASDVVTINKRAQTLTLTMLTGWEDAPVFECVYSKK